MRISDWSSDVCSSDLGTQQLQQQSQVFILGNNTHLSTRFFGYQARFRGIRSATELAHVLDGFDTQTDWPADSGISYTHYFFPGAFQGGFRFANHAETLWSTYLELAPLSIREKWEVKIGRGAWRGRVWTYG